MISWGVPISFSYKSFWGKGEITMRFGFCLRGKFLNETSV
jgi:hypothetical protein